MPTLVAKRSNQPSHLKDLILLFAVPISIAVIAAIVVYVPSMFVHPKYDFIYSYCEDYQCKDSYLVDSGGHISRDYSSVSNDYYDKNAVIYYYDAANDSTKTITLDVARNYKLNTNSKSPDGYSLSRADSSSGFLFWSESDSGWYLKNGAKKKKVELSNDNSYYSRDIKFLGWVNK